MRYAVWFVRFLFAAWMIPAGINHFIPIFPQPMGSQPLSMELIRALLDSHLFDLVKAVELLAGVMLLFGWYPVLALAVCLPVSFCVFYWDAPLEGWGSRAALFGYSTFASNVLLCLAYYKSYLPMFALKPTASQQQVLVTWGQRFFGVWMIAAGAGLFFSSYDPLLGSDGPLATQLMTSLINSHLISVAMVITLVTGVFIASGVFAPAALCFLMPITSCALFWALILDHQPLHMLLAVGAFAINGLLMLAYLPYYRGILQRRALAIGESEDAALNYEGLFIQFNGRTSQAVFIPAAITVIVAIAFFAYMVGGRTAHFCMLMLVYPAFILLARRLQDMGQSGWLALIPTVVALLAFGTTLAYFSLGETADANLPLIAVAVGVVFGLWACVGRSHGSAKTGAKLHAA
jgi:uncharacterized membrane protein YhaH (DUF805 family)